jgi:hypothetical protein
MNEAFRAVSRKLTSSTIDMLWSGDTLVVRWLVGPTMTSATERRGVVIRTVINGFTFEGSTKGNGRVYLVLRDGDWHRCAQRSATDALTAF